MSLSERSFSTYLPPGLRMVTNIDPTDNNKPGESKSRVFRRQVSFPVPFVRLSDTIESTRLQWEPRLNALMKRGRFVLGEEVTSFEREFVMRRLREGKQPNVYSDGRQLRDPIYVDDAVEAFLLAAETRTLPSRIYNLGGPTALTLLEIAKIASAAAGGPLPELCPFPPDQLLIDIGDCRADTRRIQSELGWCARVSFQEGISLTLQAHGIATQERSRCVEA